MRPRAATAGLLAACLAACVWRPEPTRIPCDDDGHCPGDHHCDAATARCAPGAPIGDDDSGDDDLADDDLADDDLADDDLADDDATDDDATDDDAGDDDLADDDTADDDDSAAPPAPHDRRYCLDWSSATLADDPLGLLSTNIRPYPLLLHFEQAGPLSLDAELVTGGGSCAPSGAPDDLSGVPTSWLPAVGDGGWYIGPIPVLQLAATGGVARVYDAVVRGAWDGAADQLVDGQITGELDITQVLLGLNIACTLAPDCHPCPAPFSPYACITLSATGARWDRAGSGSF